MLALTYKDLDDIMIMTKRNLVVDEVNSQLQSSVLNSRANCMCAVTGLAYERISEPDVTK